MNKNCLCATVLCTVIMVYKGRSAVLDLLGLALCLLSIFVSSVFMVLYLCTKNYFLLTSFSLPFSELSLVVLTFDVLDFDFDGQFRECFPV